MGQSKGGGYMQKPTLLPQQQQGLDQILQMFGPYLQQAAQGYQQFLPGGGGGEAIAKSAQNRFQQNTIPQIMQAFGSDNKGSSALNNSLASAGANLNTDLGSILAQAQLQASHGLGSLGSGLGQLGLGTPGFAYLQRQPPMWQQLLGPAIGAASKVGAAAMI